MRKRGDQSIGVTIAIVIGVILLVLLVFGVTDVWGMFRDETGVITDSNSNIDDLIDTCDLRCAGSDTYAYCKEERVIELNGKDVIKGSCYGFAEYGKDYGFKGCSKVTCESSDKVSTNMKDTKSAIDSSSAFKAALS
jgi:hypothetical protein